MLQSMTGFGKSEGTFDSKKIRVEIKSLNSKNLDLFVRLPHSYKEKEIDLRKRLGNQLERGKIECIIVIESTQSNSNQINIKAVKSYFSQLSQVADELNLPTENVLPTLMRMPDVFVTQTEEIDENEWTFILDLVEQAIKEHKAFRAKEGENIKLDFEKRIHGIQTAFNQVLPIEKERIETIKQRIETNLEEFIGLDKIDKNRFEQELIYYIEKIDISEEKQRLQHHLNYFIEVMNQPQSQGKKLGFISQEIGREINTLGSKSYHSGMQKLVVQMKDELEKIKEQILNTL